jgi:Zn-dependent protease with chaperone function
MFAIVALVCFVAKLFHGSLGSIDLVVLGFAFLALHFVWSPLTMPWSRKNTHP